MKNETEVKKPDSDVTNNTEITSILAFFGGVIVSRYGLWLADISITQIMQEGVSENKRGVIHGVQDSLNMGMDMLKSLLVILFPYPQQFGFLIVLSFIAVLLGLLSYLMYFWSSSYSKSSEQSTSTAK
ncbi:hypothetical protein C0J52_13071 [Blattella germanica]|nr:hypothetical protein C0J52_13071 [Blattella germanica]